MPANSLKRPDQDSSLYRPTASMTLLHDPLRLSQWTVRISLTLSAVAIALAIRAALNPAAPSGRGLSGLMLSLLAVVAGPYAGAVMWAAIAGLPLNFARLVWRRAPRVPSDRWWR
jgi:type IV secretory pathway VirB2 component (pilin)